MPDSRFLSTSTNVHLTCTIVYPTCTIVYLMCTNVRWPFIWCLGEFDRFRHLLRLHFRGFWKSPGTILMISAVIGKSLEFHWIPRSGWLAPESSAHGQGKVKGWSPGALQLPNNQLASSNMEYFKFVICKNWSLERISRLQSANLQILKGIEDFNIWIWN